MKRRRIKEQALFEGRLKWVVVLCGVVLLLLFGGFAAVHAAPVAQTGAAGAEADVALAIRQCPPDIQFGETIECSIDAPSEIDRYVFSAAAGDKVLVRMVSGGVIWPSVRVHGPDGEELVSPRGQWLYLRDPIVHLAHHRHLPHLGL